MSVGSYKLVSRFYHIWILYPVLNLENYYIDKDALYIHINIAYNVQIVNIEGVKYLNKRNDTWGKIALIFQSGRNALERYCTIFCEDFAGRASQINTCCYIRFQSANLDGENEERFLDFKKF